VIDSGDRPLFPLMSAAAGPAGDLSASSPRRPYVPLDVMSFATKLNARRAPAALHSMMPLATIPGLLSLAGGLPSPVLVSQNGFHIHLRFGNCELMVLLELLPVQSPFQSISIFLADNTNLSLADEELNIALQYCHTPGIQRVVECVAELQMREHAPPLLYGKPDGWSLSLAAGSSDCLTQAFDLLVEEGDPVLVESPTDDGALCQLRTLGAHLVEIEVDSCGMIPSKLEAVLDSYAGVMGLKKPKVLYVIPTGQNPAGCTLSEERKRQIYRLACKHNIIILEDDPYYFLVSQRHTSAV
jgi:kynurenine/2-aminoadipate aminotransferase